MSLVQRTKSSPGLTANSAEKSKKLRAQPDGRLLVQMVAEAAREREGRKE